MTDRKQVVIITGGGQGIGFGIGRCFARKGAHVVVADLKEERARAAAQTLEGEGAAKSLGLPCDVASKPSVDAMVAAALAAYGHIDVLVNNAGICPFEHIMDMSLETWSKCLGVNLTGPFLCTQAVARAMIEAKRPGRIIFITSLADHRTGPKQVEYGATKGGLKMLAVGFATALGPHGITCNAVAPGHVCTPLTEHWWKTEAGQAKAKEIIPMQRLGEPEDIGAAVVWLASAEAAYVNGATLRVDGGNACLA